MPQSMRGSIITTAGLPLKRAATIDVAYGAVDHGMGPSAIGKVAMGVCWDGRFFLIPTFSRVQFELIAITRGLALRISEEMAARFCGLSSHCLGL